MFLELDWACFCCASSCKQEHLPALLLLQQHMCSTHSRCAPWLCSQSASLRATSCLVSTQCGLYTVGTFGVQDNKAWVSAGPRQQLLSDHMLLCHTAHAAAASYFACSRIQQHAMCHCCRTAAVSSRWVDFLTCWRPYSAGTTAVVLMVTPGPV